MHKNKTLILMMTIIQMSVFAQQIGSQVPQDYIPPGYAINRTIEADFNNDGVNDYVIILKEERSTKGGLMALLDKNNTYEIATKNLQCFEFEKDGGVYFPPELSVEVSGGNLIILYDHGRYGSSSYIFKFRSSDFELIEFNRQDSRGPYIVEITSIDFLNRKKIIRKNTYQPKTEYDMKEDFDDFLSDISIEHLIRLSEIDSFDNIDMSVY
jgi:hypothetical protein